MAKGFRLSKGFFKEMRRLSKEAKGKSGIGSVDVDPPRGNRWSSAMVKGKGLAYSHNNRKFSLSMDMERDLAMDDMDSDDLGFDWGWNSRLAKAKVAAEAKLKELFDPDYEPWEEVCDVLADSDLEDMELTNLSGDGFSKYATDCHMSHGFSKYATDCHMSHGFSKYATDCHMSHAGESSKSNYPNEACQFVATSSHCAAGNSGVPSQFSSSGFVQHDERDATSKTVFQFDGTKCPRTTGYRHRKKQVVMGRDFLLVKCTCLQNADVGKGFQFFHTPSLSTVVVRVKKVSPVDITVELPDNHLTREDVPFVHQDGVPVVVIEDSSDTSNPEMPTHPVSGLDAKGEAILMDIPCQATDGDSACLSPVPPSTPERVDHISGTLRSRAKRIIGIRHNGLVGSRQSPARCYSSQHSVRGGFQDITSGPRHLGTKRIVEPGMRKKKKDFIVQGNSVADKTGQHSMQSKRKRERAIEADPHFCRPFQRRALS